MPAGPVRQRHKNELIFEHAVYGVLRPFKAMFEETDKLSGFDIRVSGGPVKMRHRGRLQALCKNWLIYQAFPDGPSAGYFAKSVCTAF